MDKLSSETGIRIYAWALMTNHAHILLRSGAGGLPGFIRRLLSGYAISYNFRHSRHGHLFQNRYKSIVCEADAYFKELIRYIHLNPFRAGLVKDMPELDQYLWCEHAVIMGKARNDWQKRDYVLRWFGKKEGEAKRTYRGYVEEGIGQGGRPNLVGGGLIRSMGGWSEVVSMRRLGIKERTDERILGTGDIVGGRSHISHQRSAFFVLHESASRTPETTRIGRSAAMMTTDSETDRVKPVSWDQDVICMPSA